MNAVTGLSNSTLSKIENGALSISYDNLLKLANGLDTDLPALFSAVNESPSGANSRRSVTLRGKGEVYETPQYRYEMLQSELNSKKFLPILATVRAHSIEPADMIRHPGEEWVYVLEGAIEVRLEFYAPVSLRQGDSIYFDSMMSHALVSVGEHDAKILWIATSLMPNSPHGLRGDAKPEAKPVPKRAKRK
jgi:transcriptional regulator with XRE-family HTH domain